MTWAERAARFGAPLLCGLAVSTAAWSYPADLSSGTFQTAPPDSPWAIFAYDPDTSSWNELTNLSWHEVASRGHSSYVFEATADQATAVSTFKVVFSVAGMSFEVFTTPDALTRLNAGESTTVRINLF